MRKNRLEYFSYTDVILIFTIISGVGWTQTNFAQLKRWVACLLADHSSIVREGAKTNFLGALPLSYSTEVPPGFEPGTPA